MLHRSPYTRHLFCSPALLQQLCFSNGRTGCTHTRGAQLPQMQHDAVFVRRELNRLGQVTVLNRTIPVWHVRAAFLELILIIGSGFAAAFLLKLLLRCVSKDRQLQWAVPYFLVLFYDEAKTRSETCTAAERRKQLKKSFYTAASQRLCAEWHSAIWPGVCFPEPLPTKTKDGESLGRMSEKTCDTSIMIAALASKLGEPNTYPSTTRCCHRFLKEVVTLLARASEFTVALVDLQWFRASNCRVSADGTVDGNLFWGSTCDRVDKLKAIWRERLAHGLFKLVAFQDSCEDYNICLHSG